MDDGGRGIVWEGEREGESRMDDGGRRQHAPSACE